MSSDACHSTREKEELQRTHSAELVTCSEETRISAGSGFSQ